MSRRTCEAIWLAAIAVGWGAACAGPGFSPERVPNEQRAAYEAALAKPASGPGGTQGKALEAFIAAYPASPMADDAALRLSELAFEDGRQDDGLRWLGSVLTQYPGSDREPTARLRVAELEYARDRRVAARGLLDPVDFRRLSPADAQTRSASRPRPDASRAMQNLARLRRPCDDAKRARCERQVHSGDCAKSTRRSTS
jgi:TolA-binding protein